MEKWCGVVLAAGEGRRMRSRLPKPLHRVCGVPMLTHTVRALRNSGVGPVVAVVPPGGESWGALEGARAVVQPRPGGTGQALLCARPLAQGDHLLVAPGDAPLLTPETLLALVRLHIQTGAALTLLTALGCPVEGMGRVIRGEDGAVQAVVEEREATEEQRRIREVNAGVYCLSAPWVWEALKDLRPSPSGEVYLTDLVALARRQGLRVEALQAPDPWEALGVDDRQDLARAEAVMRERIRLRWMEQGVTLLDPPTTYIDADAVIGQDTVVYPSTHILGRTVVGQGCQLGPGAVLVDSTLGDACRVVASVLEGATLEPGVDVGPFSHLRPGAYAEEGVHLGNFVEVKNARLGRGVKAGHFCYIGDASVGAGANIGAGTVTCNFDGVRKHRTEIGEGAFIGSGTMLVAPVRVGHRAVTGAGAVVTRDVPPDTVVAGVPARPLRPKGEGK